MSKIFISYRREDSADATGRIYDRLVQQFGRTAVFKDVDSIPLGINFRKHLDEQVAKCDVFLAVVGPGWMGSKAGEEKSRLDDPRDFVRIEIESALKRQIPVIPVLVRGATIPDPERLPSSLQELSDRNSIVVRPDPDFHRDMDRLIEHLRGQLEEQLEQTPFPEAHHKTSDVSARTTETRSEVEPQGQERIDAAAVTKPPARETTDQSQSYLFGVIGLIILIGGVAAFMIFQPTQPPVESIKYLPPPTVVPTTQEKSEKRQVATSIHPIPSPEMTRISPGSFLMGSGSGNEGPMHKVTFKKSFALARYETTFHEYDHFAQSTGRPLPKDEKGWGRGSRPVINVSWDDAKAYAQWLSQKTGKRYRLPTEAEWEYAARSGGKDEIWAGTSDASQLEEYAVYNLNPVEPVGSKQPNGLGLYDMSGNVDEMVEDCLHLDYKDAPVDGSAWLATNNGNCGMRTVRGGAWIKVPARVRTTTRDMVGPDSRNIFMGFRLAQDLP